MDNALSRKSQSVSLSPWFEKIVKLSVSYKALLINTSKLKKLPAVQAIHRHSVNNHRLITAEIKCN